MSTPHDRVTAHLAQVVGPDIARLVSGLYRMAEANLILADQVRALSEQPAPSNGKEDDTAWSQPEPTPSC